MISPEIKPRGTVINTSELATLCVLLLSASVAHSLEPNRPPVLEQAPRNPAFIAYQEGLRAEVADSRVRQQHGTQLAGRIPAPIDLSHLAGQFYAQTQARASRRRAYPSRYELRDLGLISPVHDQQYGDCWAYSAMASLESVARRQLGAESPDLSEWDLAYHAYVDASPTLVGFEDYSPRSFPDITADLGGNDFMATAILARGTGPKTEADVPNGVLPFPIGAPSVYRLSDVIFLQGTRDLDYLPLDPANAKLALTEYGAISVGVNAEWGLESSQYFNTEHAASYIPPDNPHHLSVSDADHAVTIIGWDDDYPAEHFAIPPPADGAWIVRNSWGRAWGDQGDFYLSYQDAVLDGGVAYVPQPLGDAPRFHQYDPLGATELSGVGDQEIWMANLFVADGPERIEAVSLFVPGPNAEYRLDIRLDVEDDPDSGIPAFATQGGVLALPGYRSIALDQPVSLTAGQRFAVVLWLYTPNWYYPMAIESRIPGYSDKASAAPGQSFFSADGIHWSDLTGRDATANIVLKAIGQALGRAPDRINHYLDASDQTLTIDSTAGVFDRYLDFGGADRYDFGHLDARCAGIEIIDRQASTLGLAAGQTLSAARFAADGLEMTLDGCPVTLLGAPEAFSFDFAGASTLDFQATAARLGARVPAAGAAPVAATRLGTIQSDGRLR